MYKEFKQEVNGYYRDINKSKISKNSGVYFVYTGSYDKNKECLILRELIYIGESKDINDRIKKHEKYEVWKKKLKYGEELIFSYTEIEENYRERLEAAYIFKHQPIVNTDCKDSFNYDKTRVISSGETIFLEKDFTLNRT